MNLEDFRKNIKELSNEALVDDLINQCHILSDALSKKFSYISKSVLCLIYLVITPILVIVMILHIMWITK